MSEEAREKDMSTSEPSLVSEKTKPEDFALAY